jgi:hypothetical protein
MFAIGSIFLWDILPSLYKALGRQLNPNLDGWGSTRFPKLLPGTYNQNGMRWKCFLIQRILTKHFRIIYSSKKSYFMQASTCLWWRCFCVFHNTCRLPWPPKSSFSPLPARCLLPPVLSVPSKGGWGGFGTLWLTDLPGSQAHSSSSTYFYIAIWIRLNLCF